MPRRSGLGVPIIGKWTWNRGLTCAGYGSYLVAKWRAIQLTWTMMRCAAANAPDWRGGFGDRSEQT